MLIISAILDCQFVFVVVFDSLLWFGFLLFQKINQIICIKFCVKNLNVDCGVCRKHKFNCGTNRRNINGNVGPDYPSALPTDKNIEAVTKMILNNC